MRHRLLIFDFDGTLANSQAAFLHALNQCADHFGFRRVSYSLFGELRGYSGREVVRRLGVPAWKLPAIAISMRRLMHERIAEIGLFPGIGEVLASLDEHGLRLALVTSNSERTVRLVLGPANLQRFAHCECGASLFGKAKRLRAVLRATGIPAHEALYVGDEIRDAHAAAAAHVDFLGVSWGYTSETALQPHSRWPLLRHPRELALRLVATATA